MTSKFFQKGAERIGLIQVVGLKAYRSRLLLFFGSSCAVSLVGFFLYAVVFRSMDSGAIDPRKLYSDALFLLVPTVFILGILLVLFAKPSILAMQILDYVSVALVLAILTWMGTKSDLGYSWRILFGVVILWHAAAVPSLIAVQAILSITAIVAYVLGKLLIVDFSISLPFLKGLASGTLELSLLLLIGLAFTRTLYRSRENQFQAEALGNYRILRELGTGGMGKVYAASHPFLLRPTAIKIMQPKVGGDFDNAVARFEKEVKLSATLMHPNTITIFDYGACDDNTLFYSMELLDGLDLQRLVDRFGPMPANRAIYNLLQVCSALVEAHEKGIVHRDIKPSNIFLCRQVGIYDFVKVLDFGLAKELGSPDKSGLTQSGEVLGTPRYMAPECVTKKEQVDFRTDIYMLGAVAYFMVTGRAPFESTSSVEVIVEHLKTIPKNPTEVSELEIPPELEGIILKCLEKKQEDRFQNIHELETALEKIPQTDPWTKEKARAWWSLHFSERGTGFTSLDVGPPPVLSIKSVARARRL